LKIIIDNLETYNLFVFHFRRVIVKLLETYDVYIDDIKNLAAIENILSRINPNRKLVKGNECVSNRIYYTIAEGFFINEIVNFLRGLQTSGLMNFYNKNSNRIRTTDIRRKVFNDGKLETMPLKFTCIHLQNLQEFFLVMFLVEAIAILCFMLQLIRYKIMALFWQ